MRRVSGLLILIAGILWGCIGLFIRQFDEVGLVSMQIVALRALVTCVAMFLFLLLFHRNLLRVRWKDLWCFLGTGLCSILFFNYCYFKAITLVPLSVAAILLYTAPAIVMVLSYFLFHEKLTIIKLISLGMTFFGCMLVTGVLGDASKVTLEGMLTGLGAGLGYALYSIFSRYAINKGYHTFTITFYTFLITTLGTFFLTDYHMMAKTMIQTPSLILWGIALGIICTVLPYLTYTVGLKHIENSKASIIASIEPVTATMLGFLFFQEQLSFTNALGIIIVIAALVLCSRTGKKEK